MFTCCRALLVAGCTRLPMRITLQLIWSFPSVGNYDYSTDQALVKTLKGPRVQYHNLNVFKLKLISHPSRLRGPKLV